MSRTGPIAMSFSFLPRGHGSKRAASIVAPSAECPSVTAYSRLDAADTTGATPSCSSAQPHEAATRHHTVLCAGRAWALRHRLYEVSTAVYGRLRPAQSPGSADRPQMRCTHRCRVPDELDSTYCAGRSAVRS